MKEEMAGLATGSITTTVPISTLPFVSTVTQTVTNNAS
jgi:hypothetical protein